MGQIKEIADETEAEVEEYLEFLGWEENPFTEPAGVDEYVLPSREDIADVTSHIQNYTGFILVHSRYSGVGKTTLLRVVLDEFSDSHETVYVGEHNVTPYELVALVADKLGVGKSSSTKMTEEKLREAEFDEPVLIGVDEFGLNDPDTLHVIQFLNDCGFKVILTGMTSQWNAIENIGSDGRAFQRRVSHRLQLEAFEFEQSVELFKRRVATVSGVDQGEWESVELEPFITRDALREVHERSSGVPAVVTSSLAELVGLGAYQFVNGAGETVTVGLAEELDYPDPEADSE